MAVTLNETPGSSRLHIGIFGKTNSGKSALINAFTGQEVSIVANVAGTTTDPVYKAMEVHPLGPCIIIDTAGFGDESELGKSRMEKTRLAAEKTDIALLLVAGNGDAALDEEEMHWYCFLKEHGTPVLFVVGKRTSGRTHRWINWQPPSGGRPVRRHIRSAPRRERAWRH